MTEDPSPAAAPTRKFRYIWWLILGPLVGLYVGSLSTYARTSPANDAIKAVVVELKKIKATSGSLPDDLATLPAHLQPEIKEFNIRISADGRTLESTTTSYYDPSFLNLLTLGLVGEKMRTRNPGFLLDRL
jgi:hypothetical protein